ncbi:hypothetical protein QX249_11430 [Vibrio parahaemolyticus]|uniref:Uncharacterized protein n=1 Tax=Vibrio parahaemolyticus TaxID=670 RepID=A0AAW8PYH6_VIBPH|nr:hypothetical protein [Vibrio parahaemolyticus]EGR2227226.1 hypothetical protein [Vibrio parahaemolyticus]MDS1821276.1 hypothetical protein [Vibrio parahaemolyticus]
MNVKKKAQEIVDKLVSEDGLDVGAKMHRAIEARIEKALKEQDRDTRHACAEAVITCETKSNDLISKDEAHNICMNINAVS